jgi:hypothetical protein
MRNRSSDFLFSFIRSSGFRRHLLVLVYLYRLGRGSGEIRHEYSRITLLAATANNSIAMPVYHRNLLESHYEPGHRATQIPCTEHKPTNINIAHGLCAFVSIPTDSAAVRPS